MTMPGQHSPPACRVVTGADAVRVLRADDPLVPIVALVEASSPSDAVLAQTAGADVVLPVDGRRGTDERVAGLDLAIRTATTIADRRRAAQASARRAKHDVAEALNVIGLAAEAGQSGRIGPDDAFGRIRALVDDAAHRPWPSSVTDHDRSGFLVDQATVQADILEGVVRHAPLEESLEAIVAAIEHQLPGAVCSVLLLRDGRSLHHGAGRQLPLAYRDAIDGVAIGPGQGSCGTAAFTGEPVIATDVATDERWVDFRDVALEHGLRSCWSTPIVAADGGDMLGTFAVYKRTVWRPDSAAIRLVNRFTYLAAVAIEHHRLFGALAESEARFRNAFEGATAGIALTSTSGSIMRSNPSLSKLVGHTPAELEGSNLLELVDARHRDAVRRSWCRLTEPGAGDPRSLEVRLVAPTGADELWVSMNTSLIPAESDRTSYLYVAVRDITAARQQRADMAAREAAEAANRAKTDFLALASHELRSPLNAILGFAQVMQLVDLAEEQRSSSVDQIVSAGRHLRDLIDRLLDLSRIESGELAVAVEPVVAADVVGEALDLVRPLAAAREIELAVQVAGSVPPAAADARCMRQVLINLLDNAVKYTPVGGRVEVSVSHAAGERIRVAVADTGPGIDPASLDAVFQPFRRLELPDGEDRSGTGLGLALCARLMREMNGAIDVVSTVGVGSTFHVEFPIASAATDGSDLEPSAVSPVPRNELLATAGTVLYIEDDAACVEVMRAALALRPGVTLRTASTASAGLAELSGGGIDLVVLDIGLPDRPGWEVLADVDTRLPGLPAIVVTAGDSTVPAGAPRPDQLLTKPLDIAELIGAVDVALGATGAYGRPEPAHALDQ